MRVKLRVSVLIHAQDTVPTRGGTVVNLDEEMAKEFLRTGLAEQYKAPEKEDESVKTPEPKKPPAHATAVVRPASKMLPDANNKMAPGAETK